MRRLPSEAKQSLVVHLDDMDQVIARLQQDSRRLQQFELCYCIVSLLTVFASLNNFQLSEAKNLRIILYCVMILIFDLARTASFQQHIIDPLGMHIRTRVLQLGQQLLIVDMLYLLIRVVHHIPLSQSLFVIGHYFYTLATYLKQERQAKPEPPAPLSTFSYRRLQPALLFVLCKIIPSEFSEVSLLFLCSSTINIMVLSEVDRIALYDSDLVLSVWHEKLLKVEDVKGKKPNSRTRRLLVKNSMILLSVLVVVQNLLLVFEVLRFEVATGLIQTLTVGGYMLRLYRQISEEGVRN